jgi:hypothetical protein
VLGHVLSPVRSIPRHSLLLIANKTSVHLAYPRDLQNFWTNLHRFLSRFCGELSGTRTPSLRHSFDRMYCRCMSLFTNAIVSPAYFKRPDYLDQLLNSIVSTVFDLLPHRIRRCSEELRCIMSLRFLSVTRPTHLRPPLTQNYLDNHLHTNFRLSGVS